MREGKIPLPSSRARASLKASALRHDERQVGDGWQKALVLWAVEQGPALPGAGLPLTLHGMDIPQSQCCCGVQLMDDVHGAFNFVAQHSLNASTALLMMCKAGTFDQARADPFSWQ